MKSFAGVEGYGANTTGGRGGQVVTVTNSNDSGQGSLRWALEQVSGPRTVVFDINEVRLNRDLNITDGDVTIAGQTAGGVQVTGATLNIRDGNVIMRGMILRPGDSRSGPDPDNRDALQIGQSGKTVSNVVIDHNSFQWAVDETVSIWDKVTNLTFSNNIVAQGLDRSIHSKGAHSMGLLVIAPSPDRAADRLTISDNLFAYNGARNPWIKHGTQIEFINNAIFGPDDQAYSGTWGDSDSRFGNFSANVINNYYQAGPETRRTEYAPNVVLGTAAGDAYFSGNLSYDDDGRQISAQSHGNSAASSKKFGGSDVSIMSASQVERSVLANAGANPGDRDPAIQRVVDSVAADRGGLVDSVSKTGGAGGRDRFVKSADSDGDGIPDWYEDRVGTNKRAADANGDANRNGFTNIEDYINSLLPGGGGVTSPVVTSPEAPASPAPSAPVSSGTTAGRTGTGLDIALNVIDSDSGLARNASSSDLAAGKAAAAGLNKIIVDGIRALGIANDKYLSMDDVRALSNWIRADGELRGEFETLYGKGEQNFQRVLDEGGTSRLHGAEAIDQVFGTIYRVGFGIDDAVFGGPSGSERASVWQATTYLLQVLREDLASGSLAAGTGSNTGGSGSGGSSSGGSVSVGSSAPTGTGLDRIVDLIKVDRPLSWHIERDEILEGAEAAAQLNRMLVDGVEARGLMRDGKITANEIGSLGEWVRSNSDRHETFLFLHGDSPERNNDGYQAVVNKGAGAKMFNLNAVNTVFDGIYDFGFTTSGGDIKDDTDGKTTPLVDVAQWMTVLLSEDYG